MENVKPPRAGVPATPVDVEGIYRSVHQALLQLRGDGSFVLITPNGPGPTAGTYTLQNGLLEVRTRRCGPDRGSYSVTITGAQEAGKATLNLSARNDLCLARRQVLAADPWVYADS